MSIPSARHLLRLSARVERAAAAAGPPAAGLPDAAKAKISLMLGGPGDVSERHRLLLSADPADPPTPAGAARVLEWSGVSLLHATPEAAAAWILAKIAAFATTEAPAVSLFDMATGPAPTGSEPETDEDCL